MRWRILVGDVRETLATLPEASVQCVVTSPPYWGLRDYGHAGQIGLESTPAEYVAAMVEVFAGVWRVLRDDGTCWINLGDSYAAQGGAHGGRDDNQSGVGARRVHLAGAGDQAARVAPTGLKPKDLVGIPWMVAFALRDAGWYLRSDIIWHKPNPMPESVSDRPTKAHEYIFLLTKSARYYYNADAISEPTNGNAHSRGAAGMPFDATSASSGERLRLGKYRSGNKARTSGGAPGDRPDDHLGRGVPWEDNGTRNRRSVWTITTQPYRGAHFATFPEALVEPCILAGSRPGDMVLDPFTGSGTTGAVAIRHQRSFVGCELSSQYVEMARKRIGAVAPLLSTEGGMLVDN